VGDVHFNHQTWELTQERHTIRTFTDWQEQRPGFVEVDLVAHCGESVDGFYLNTLMAVDVATLVGVYWSMGEKDNSAWVRPSIMYSNDYHSTTRVGLRQRKRVHQSGSR